MNTIIEELLIEKLNVNDYEQLLHAMKAAYPNWQGNYWSIMQLKTLLTSLVKDSLLFAQTARL